MRITSHGATGTIIKSERDKSFILSCAHMVPVAGTSFQIDARPQANAPSKLAKVTLAKLDTTLDLALLELDAGPYATIQVAPAGYKPGPYSYCLGYPQMKWPASVTETRILKTDQFYTYTWERPERGTSGGPLINGGYLIGVVKGFESTTEGCGMYVSHEAILKFLGN